MGRSPCCSKEGLKRGAWTEIEDQILRDYVLAHGEGKWRNIPKQAGLKRCGKSCRMRWLNYLRPGIKRGNITLEEEDLIIRLHNLLGNRWSLIAGRLPGRTDNEIKNYWNTNLAKKVHKSGHEQQNHCSNHKTRIKNKTKLSEISSQLVADNKAEEPTVTAEDEDSQNLYTDFGVGELLLSDIPDSEFWKLCNQMLEQKGRNSYDNNNGGPKLSNDEHLGSNSSRYASHDDEHLFVSEELMLKEWMDHDVCNFSTTELDTTTL